MIFFGLAAAACVSSVDADEGQGNPEGLAAEADGVVRTTIVPTMRPTPAADLGIALDRFGKPYDNYVGPQGATAEERLLTTLKIDRGRFYLLAGDALLSGDPIGEADKIPVTFRNNTDLDVRLIWRLPPDPDSESDSDSDSESDSGEDAETDSANDSDEEPGSESILGVRIGIRDRIVAQWGRLQPAYETSDGLGGLISRTAFEAARDVLKEDEPVLSEGLVAGRPFLLDDLAGERGRDLFLFENGSGRGSYFYTEGFDEERIKVAIMIWDTSFPWRLAVPVGEPPSDVVEREQKLTDCIEGRRAIDRWGRCT